MANPGPDFSETPWGASSLMTSTKLAGFPGCWPAAAVAAPTQAGAVAMTAVLLRN